MNSKIGNRRTAVIAGAGPAGLTAALELLRRSDIIPIVFESDTQVGGISKTIEYRGNRMDLGGHRFFSKSDWVMRWWQEILPLETQDPAIGSELRIHYQGESHTVERHDRPSHDPDSVLLIRKRLSRIFYRRKFFNYPLTLDTQTIGNLGLSEAIKLGFSYGMARIGSRLPENSLEDFLINRFGPRLYRTFFRDYTEKVWGVPCDQISAEWGAQRIKGLSISKAIQHAFARPFRTKFDSAQKGIETSLIERFLYPKFGPGQMWEEVCKLVRLRGGLIHCRHKVVGLKCDGSTVVAVHARDLTTGAIQEIPCDFFVSTMPVRELVSHLTPLDREAEIVARQLPYRDFMTVGLLVNQMSGLGDRTNTAAPIGMPPDNWIYVQEPDVRLGRLQVFNNWSPALVADPSKIWLGLEYFCQQDDDLWSMSDGAFIDFAATELEKIGLISRRDVIDGTLVRVPKAYPAYFGSYGEFSKVRTFLDRFTNMYPIGRNGMHRYNNQDHSMLAANAAVESIVTASPKTGIWEINTDDQYHESETPARDV